MSQYQVPQFIDVEDKVFGPLTIKQFLYIGLGAGFDVILYSIFLPWVLFALGIPVTIFVLALAFYKHNGIPFPKVVRSMMRYAFTKKLYLWKKKVVSGSTLPPLIIPNQQERHPLYIQPPHQNRKAQRLQDLAWSLDIKQNPNE